MVEDFSTHNQFFIRNNTVWLVDIIIIKIHSVYNLTTFAYTKFYNILYMFSYYMFSI